MSDFVACVAIEQGGYWIVAGAVFVAVTLLVAIVLCVRAFRRALKDPHSKIAIIVRSWSIKAGGASSALVYILAIILLLVSPLGTLWLIYDRFADHYSVSVDARGADSLESIRLALNDDPNSRVTVVIPDRLKPFKVQGAFSGACVADLFDAICRAYQSDLRCTRSYRARTLNISSP